MVNQKRLRIGIFLRCGSNAIGELYYIKNVIESLGVLEDAKKPEIILFYIEDSAPYVKEFNYEYLETRPYKPVHKYLGYFYSWLVRKNLFTSRMIAHNDLDGLFPINDTPIRTKQGKTKIISWFPDLQHKFYPQYFPRLNVILREYRLKLLLKNTDGLVVSSQDVLSHFRKFYTLPQSLKVSVLPFISNIEKSTLEYETVRKKYGIEGQYFIVSNQFYEHKNHKVVFEAIGLLLKEGKEVQVVFTGKFEDYKNLTFTQKLEEQIERLGIKTHIKILGIIPREEQICLLENSIAVIQPSLFEGWSSIVEDVKTLQIPILVSDIAVHFEQLGDEGHYFKSTDSQSLANLMQEFTLKKPTKQPLYDNDHKMRTIEFANRFVDIFK